MLKKAGLITMVLILGLNLPGFHSGSPSENLSIQEMYSELLLEKLNTSQYLWLNNGKIMLLDSRVEEKDRNFALYDPQTKRISPAMDAENVLTEIKKMCGEDAPQAVQWPDAFDRNGEKAVTILAGDLFLMELKKSMVTRFTHTEPPESSVSFSPDGEWIGFIRDNDIYVINVNNGKEKRMTTGATETLLNGPLSWAYWEEIYSHTEVPYKWSPDSRAIAYLQTDDASVSVSTYVNFKPASQEAVRQNPA